MKLKFPKYPSYKSSGIEWLGDVPSHWEVKRMRFMLTMNPSKREISKLPEDTEVSFFPMEAVGENGELSYDQTRAIDDVSSGYTFFGENDVAFAKITPCFENGKGAIMRNLVCGCGFGTTELTVLRCSDRLDPEFLFHVTKSNLFRQNGEAWMYGAGGQKRVPDEYVKNLRFSLPPLPEQKAIAAFLDRETERIDGLIGKREKLIALLQEKRAALISHAVTKGLNPRAKMKPSGIDWLGDVPAHWEVKKFKYLLAYSKAAIKTGPFGSQLLSSEMEESDVKVYNQKNVITKDFVGGDNYISSQKFLDLKEFQTFPNDILVTTRGTIGRCAVLPQDADVGILHPCLMRIQVDQCLVFIHYLEIVIAESRIVLEQVKVKSNGTTIEVIYQDTLKGVQIPLPPLSEQGAIAAHLDSETKKIDGLMEREQQIIERMKEYRSALISAAVTGKIDVREGV